VDTSEPGSTNLYVSGLPLDINERRLAEMFAIHGDVASVKIMWPRAEEGSSSGAPPARRPHCGFVCFMRREDAERAMQDMQNKHVAEGCQLKINWSRGVPMPTHPYMRKQSAQSGGSSSGSGSGTGANGAPSSSSRGSVEPPPLPAPVADSFPFPVDAVKYQVEFPAERDMRALIDMVASHVATQGLQMEQALAERARAAAAAPGTPDASLAFLVHPASLEALYYRWRVYSLAQGDSLRHWRSTPFQMVAGGPYFVPPDWARWQLGEERRKSERRRAREQKRDAVREAERAERRRTERTAAAAPSSASKGSNGNWDRNESGDLRDKGTERGRLSASASSMLTDLLRSVSMDRASVRDVMGWSLDHADCARDVVAHLVDSLTLDATPLPKKIARLYVVSDLLYNSSAPIPNASAFRALLQEALPPVMHSFHLAHARALASAGRITADALRGKVSLVLRAWGQWGVFPQQFLDRIEEIFNKGDTALAAQAGNGPTTMAS